MQYIQYDENGNIGAVVNSDGPAPACARQIAFLEPQFLVGMMVDVETKTLVKDPNFSFEDDGAI